AFGRHEPGKLGFVHKVVANVVIGAAAQTLLKKSERGLEHERRLKARLEHWLVERHIPFVDDHLGLFQLRILSQPALYLANAGAKKCGLAVIDVPREKMKRSLTLGAMFDQRCANLAAAVRQRRAATLGFRILTQNR